MPSKKTPYENARSGAAARDEISKILHGFGCESVGFMDNFSEQSVLLAFRHRGQDVHLLVSAKGWASMWLKNNPWTNARKSTKQEWQQKAIDQGLIAVNSILRDWIKGQITAVECGILSFEAVFMPYILLPNGKPMIEHVQNEGLLPTKTDQC